MFQEERKKVTFDVNELSTYIYGGAEGLKHFLEIQRKVSEDPVLKFNPEYIQVSRKELFEITAKQLVRYHELFQISPEMKSHEGLFFSETLPLSVHFSMFYSVLRNLCTEKQKKMFLEPAYDGKIFGCYAQTELGHGSDIQNIETTATYDPETETFVMHSPSESAIKWWVGELGVFANHACVMAQLYVAGKKLGPHAFIVNIRDMETHKPLEGIEVGDIGPKFGYNAKDNGYLKLTNVKIPRDNMLSRYSKVHKNGEYERRGNQKVSYATMLMIRAGIPKSCFWGLSKAVTIITRYSLVRKQFKNQQGEEIKIMDYQLQQDKVIPYIADTYALMFGSRALNALGYEILHEVQDKGDFSRLNSTHCLSSGLKSVFTSDSLKALEVIRRAAGGHGFSSYSGIPLIHTELAPTVTYQGENTILHLQVARFTLKSLDNITKGKPVASIAQHLREASRLSTLAVPISSSSEFHCPEFVRRAMMNNSYHRTVAASQKLLAGITEGLSPKESWDYYSGLSLVEASTAFTYYWIYNNFMENVVLLRNEAIRKSLNKLLCLYGVNKILEYSGSYFQGGILTSEAIKFAFTAKQELLADLRNDALGLVEGFAYDDNTLKSAIGRQDGKAYETLLDWAKNSNRVNRPEVQRQFIELMNANKGKIQIAKL